MKIAKYILFCGASLMVGLSSCVGDLDVKPTNPTDKTELTSKDEYIGLIMRAYAGLVMEGGISVDDGGAGVYTRQLFNQQELPTDECVIAGNWDDVGIDELVYAQPSADNHWIYEMYSRINFQIALCNSVIATLNNAGEFLTADEIAEFQAELRILRNLSYYHMIDIFGVGPWTDENSVVGEIPPTYTRKELFEAVVADLSDAIEKVVPAAQQEYGRLSREAGLALLAKLYLNAEVYTGTPMWQQCADACLRITQTIPNLAPTYKYLFCADNHQYVASSTYGTNYGEILWTVPQDEITMQTYGGTTYLSGGAYAAVSPYAQYGLQTGPWAGPHMRPETVNRFEANDNRALFYAGEFELDLNDISTWGDAGTSGYQCIKFVYTPSEQYELPADVATKDEDGNYIDPLSKYLAKDIFNSADMPLFRLADIYLMLAECQLPGHGATGYSGIDFYNKVRTRAGLAPVSSYTADNLLDERNRELYWECHRRSDLIRFNKYTNTGYNWQWKGAVRQGTSIEAFRNLMPIPTQFTATLGQNPGY
ncbi:MAG: RagB/SusD family nutrient uptake outer membrane protein [Muribaculaceae bacterium]|nr:RagB/SusD family nutrient uptake outer membrane protein [Muribaculaceae bacterium]